MAGIVVGTFVVGERAPVAAYTDGYFVSANFRKSRTNGSKVFAFTAMPMPDGVTYSFGVVAEFVTGSVK